MMQRTILLGAIALIAGTYLQLFGFNLPVRQVVSNAPDIEGFFWPEQKALSEFDMVGTGNRPYGLEDIKSRWSFMFFGYTHCPDICPITMHTLRQARDRMKLSPEIDMNLIDFLFVSVDGERDTPDHLNEYIGFFGENFAAITGSKAQVDSLTSQIGVPYSIDEHEPGSVDYLVGHSGAIFLVSPEGKLASIFHPPHKPEALIDRFRSILNFYGSRT